MPRVLEAFAWVGLLTASLSTLLLVRGGSATAVSLLLPQAFLWWRWFVVFHVAVAIASALLILVVSLTTRRRSLSRVALQVGAAVVLGILCVGNGATLGRLYSEFEIAAPWPATAATLGILALIGLALGAAWRWPMGQRAVGVLAVAACFLGLQGVSGSSNGGASSIPVAATTTQQRLLVIGLDGADWDFVEPLIDRGDLPHLAALRKAGVWGELRTIRPTRSAPIWTSVVTGVTPRRHGVINNSVERLRGSYYRLPNLLPMPRALGAGALERLLRRWGIIAPSTVASFDRRVPALWNIATHNESPIDFINWWASWPAEQIRGHMISDRTHFWRSRAKGHSVDRGFVTYPDGLLLDLTARIMRPDEVTREHALPFMEVSVEEFEEMKTTPYRHHRLKSEFKYLYSMFVSNLRIAIHLMDIGRREIGRPNDLFILFRVIDQASHQALEYSELVDNHLTSTPAEIEKYSRVVTEAYRVADRAVGRLVEGFGEGNVVVVSDHGFKLLRARQPGAAYDHSGSSAPDGIFIGAGPAFRTGRVEGLGIYDMMPLFLALKGWPVAEDFVSGVPKQVFAEDFLERHPVEWIDSYGTMAVSLPQQGPIVADEEMIERLRALGYLD